jgi:hypothetical protein
MSDTRKKHITNLVAQKKTDIKNIDDSFFGNVGGVSQAIARLKDALEKIEICLDRREFIEASNLGYSEVSSEFVFLQRVLGGLNDTVTQKDILIQDICLELCNQLKKVSYEEVAPFVTQEMESLKPNETPQKIEIFLGKKTVEKLYALKNIRHTPIEHIAESIVASAMQKDEKYWQELENSSPQIQNIKDEQKESYTSDEVFNHIKALGEQHKQRHKNLY